jgi:hypothetical protein
MMPEMSIELNWLPPFQGTPEIGRTSATIQIRFGAENATHSWDLWSDSVQDGARLSAYPLALWLASAWWRIRWEPLPSRVRLAHDRLPADAPWRMNHELPAAGYGFVWPRLCFASDGESIRVVSRQSPSRSREPVRYLSDFDLVVPAREFEVGIDAFLERVLRRLEPLGETDLHVLWREVVSERADREQAAARKIEARLGYDPDQAPSVLVERLLTLAADVGADAADEIAPVCAGGNPQGTLHQVIDLASRPGISGRISIPERSHAPQGTELPWQHASQLAASVRKALGLGAEPLDDRSLAGFLQISPDDLNGKPPASAALGLAVRTGNGRDLKLHFRKKNRPARRFEAARFIADYLAAGESDRWLPITDAATARQKLQRAFAAEFLCPIASLRSYLGDEFDPEAFEDAAEYFGISEMAIKSHLANHHLVPRTFVDPDAIS